jgi:UDP:flavonoid glycosyltransferase YjiC (YdhE family)
MRGRGFDAAAIAAEIEALAMDDWRARTRLGAQVRALRTIGARARFDAGDLQRAIAATRPEAVIVDTLAWGALAAAEAWGGPWCCYCPFPPPLPSRTAPPPGFGLRPARGPLGRVRDGLLRSFSNAGFERTVGPTFHELRANLGLPPLGRAVELFERAPLHLYMSAEPFEYQRPDWPESVVMVGPCVWEPAAKPPAQLAEVDEPLVLVTTSTEFQGDERLVCAALEALAEEPLHVVATMPSGNAGGIELPANATVLGFAPHLPILARCACAITAGGMGATQKALSQGVPVCAVPFGRDQPEVARRVEVAGAGTRLPARWLNPRRLRAKVREAIACRPGAERVARGFAAAGGPAAAADAIERQLLGARPEP